MTFGVDRFRFVPLGLKSLERLRPEMERRRDDLTELRTAVEASALFYTAMKQEALNPGDVVAVELAEPDSGLASEKRVTVYLAD
ncbi:hypothetical protein ABID21_001699 [Pseudorhizobium tarimense]|uniref:Uncharacterized protein n=1 Tax=Pseudorhizobium tarimense TaxID=1079109 RepID=A0ABV2H4W5_9HYPH|nr:hypothetical protein [Pseudorhizobium tarimense]MCJ8518809.1 hypothetical protein [Pseudorhizobium tarimense]